MTTHNLKDLSEKVYDSLLQLNQRHHEEHNKAGTPTPYQFAIWTHYVLCTYVALEYIDYSLNEFAEMIEAGGVRYPRPEDNTEGYKAASLDLLENDILINVEEFIDHLRVDEDENDIDLLGRRIAEMLWEATER